MHKQTQNLGGGTLTKENHQIDIGFVITKAPLESSLVTGITALANHALDKGKTIGLLLISDGVWLGKRNQKNNTTIAKLIEKGAEITISNDHLKASGIQHDELLKGVEVTDKPYNELVERVMERWNRVITI